MTDRYKDKRVLVADSGHAVDFAVKLAESVGEVAYWTPSYGAGLRSQVALAGDGLDSINRVLDFWPAARESDLIVFANAGFGEIQEQCDTLGMLTYGPGVGDALQLRRWNLKRRLADMGMPVAESHLLTGVDQLRRFLKGREDFWVKASRFRGDFKSFRCRDYAEAEPVLDYLTARLGAASAIYPFVVEKHIEAVLELSYGGDCILGKFPEDEDYAMCGVWCNGGGYLGVAKPYGELPEDIRAVNDGLSELLSQSGYAGLFSTRVRIAQGGEQTEPKRFEDCPMLHSGGSAYLIGVSCRVPHVFTEWVGNWPEKLFRGARGEYVSTQPTWRYAAEIGLSGRMYYAWHSISVDSDALQSVKLDYHCRIDDKDYSVPRAGGWLGSAIGLGDELKDTIGSVLDVADDASGPSIKAHEHCLFEIIEELRASGVDLIDDDLPSAEDFAEIKKRGRAVSRKLRKPEYALSGGGGYLDSGGESAPVIPPTPEEVETAIAGAGGEGMLGAGGEGIEGAGGGAFPTLGGAAGDQMTGAAGELIEGANE